MSPLYSYTPYSTAATATAAMIAGCREDFLSSLSLPSLLLPAGSDPKVLSALAPSTTPTPFPLAPVPVDLPLIVFAAFGVGVVVQYHLPSARAHASPSLAVSYGSVWLMVFPAGSSSQTCPPPLDRLMLIFSDGYAAKLFGDILVPSGN